MTQEEKQLILKELCARLYYGVICTDLRHGDSKITNVDIEDGLVYCFDFDEYVKVENCHLYLRSMSSMTEEEFVEYEKANDLDTIDSSEALRKNMEARSRVRISKWYHGADWLNAHHFDYRGLIDKGLAIEAPEDMYKIK